MKHMYELCLTAVGQGTMALAPDTKGGERDD